ncbi:MAG: MerR family transcriptional regulator [Ignavibacteriae bacterium]|nr:MAG: MerR family transcriptional regulator [Ignavibacteriota bacterium]
MKSSIERLYYSITDVSKMIGEEQHVLRYWEREFPQLRPRKNRAENRVYGAKDLEVLAVIKRLLREERYTVAGAKEYLRQHGVHEDGIVASGETTSHDVVVASGIGVDPLKAQRAQELANELREIAKTIRKRTSAS